VKALTRENTYSRSTKGSSGQPPDLPPFIERVRISYLDSIGLRIVILSGVDADDVVTPGEGILPPEKRRGFSSNRHY
jgi:hypothetical protein